MRVIQMRKTERITVAGFGGQGVMMIGQMLAYAGNEIEINSLWFPSYGPETRGGTANCAVILSEGPIYSPVFSKADTLIALNGPSLDKFKEKVQQEGIIIYNSSLIHEFENPAGATVYAIPFNDLAHDLGNSKVANMIALGAYLEITKQFEDDIMHQLLSKFLTGSKSELIEINKQALQLGRNYIRKEQ
jgi:2-oxoglutarate ferredoxin oxidoreductase subunit gamma